MPNMTKSPNKTSVQGFTFIEVTLVMAILSILAVATLPYLSNFLVRNNYYFTQDVVVGSIRRAQANAMNGKNGESWGVCRSGNNIRLYAGSCGSPAISDDYAIPNNVSVSNFGDIPFSLRGEPSGAFTATVSAIGESKDISVNATGGIKIN